MIEIEVVIEDSAWSDVLPAADAVVRRAVGAALGFRTAASTSSLGPRVVAGLVPAIHPETTAGPGWVCGTSSGMTSEGGPVAPALQAPAEGGLTILLADDAMVRDLNVRFRGRDAATNVLSFPAAASAAPHLGDVALAFGVCAAEARAQGKPLTDHLSHLVVHGVLHLLGYDHEDEAEADAMEATERAILAALGIPDPYAVSDHG